MAFPRLLSIDMYIARSRTKFGAGRPGVSAVLDEKDRNASYSLANCYLSLALGLQHAYLSIILTVLTEFLYFVHIYLLDHFFKSFHEC